MANLPNILVMAGGTGGHIYPALSVAHELISRGYKVSWLGSNGGMEQELVSRESIPIDLLPVTGVRGKGKLALLKAPFTLAFCVFKAMRYIFKSRAKLVVGFGGFASGPGGIAAKLLARKLLIHEQNAVAGFTNTMLAKVSNRVCQAFDGTFSDSPKVFTTGNPVRNNIVEARKHFDSLGSRPLNILVVGGSRGAKILNDQLPELFRPFLLDNKINVWHQTGKGNKFDVASYYNSFSPDTKVDDFIHNMNDAYEWADLVICRSGALTVSEVAVIGLPAVFVPFPYAVDDHQTANAKMLSDKGAAKLVKQSQLEAIEDILTELVTAPERLAEMAKIAKSLAITDASTKIADFCEALIKREQNL